MIFHTLIGFVIAGLMLPLANKSVKLRLISWWCRHLLSAFNIRIQYTGDIPQNPHALKNTMVIVNHISWADIHVITSLVPVRFIAKYEISTWPVFGYLATKANALFIDRAKRQDAAKTVITAVASLQAGDNICLFPEGTTTDGTQIKPFKSSLIQAAIDAQSTIIPAVIYYPLADGSVNTEISYAGETTLPESMNLVLSQKNPNVVLHFLPPISPENAANLYADRRALTAQLHQVISEAYTKINP